MACVGLQQSSGWGACVTRAAVGLCEAWRGVAERVHAVAGAVGGVVEVIQKEGGTIVGPKGQRQGCCLMTPLCVFV
jgi:hypothetical protein